MGIPALTSNLDEVAAMIGADADRGCWYDYNLEDCVFPSNMVYFVDALCGYMSLTNLMARQASRGLVSG